jgi:hypothetical protein
MTIKLCRTGCEAPLRRAHLQLLTHQHRTVVARGTMEGMAFWHDEFFLR